MYFYLFLCFISLPRVGWGGDRRPGLQDHTTNVSSNKCVNNYYPL